MGFGKDGLGQIIYDSVRADMGGLAGLDAVVLGGKYLDALVEDFRIMKMDYWMGLLPAQAVVLINGPILIGIANGKLTAAQIEEALEAVPVNSNDPALEESNRAVWPLETFMIPDADAADNATIWRKGTFNPRWTFNNPDGWQWFAYNYTSSAIVTGSIINIQAKCFGMWVS